MKGFCKVLAMVLLFFCLADNCQAAGRKNSIYRKNGYVTYYYPGQRGYVAVRYPDGKGGYNTYYIRTYRNTESKDMNDVLCKGTIDFAVLGLLGTLN